MVDYSNGKIYKIQSLNGDEIYVGSTTEKLLSKRLSQHKYGYDQWKKGNSNKVMAYDLIDKYGIEDLRISLLESVECESKEELTSREAHYIKTLNCINKYVPLRTKKEYYQDNTEAISLKGKLYYEDNKKSILTKVKQYGEKNRVAIKEYQKEYGEKNKETLSLKSKLYYENNKDKLKAKNSAKCQCDCGSIHRYGDKAQHLKSKKHQDFINQ